MREQSLDLANPETTRREHLPRTPQDDQGDREETRSRPFLQYPECREARRRILEVRHIRGCLKTYAVVTENLGRS